MACSTHCATNQECSGHIPPCNNSYPFSAISSGTVIYASKMNELRDAVNGAYARRSMSYPSWPNFPVSPGNVITAERYNTIKNNINVYSLLVILNIYFKIQIVFKSKIIKIIVFYITSVMILIL